MLLALRNTTEVFYRKSDGGGSIALFWTGWGGGGERGWVEKLAYVEPC